MESLPSLASPRHEIGLLENGEMFRDRLAGHVQPLAELPESLSILLVKLVEELATAGVRQGSKNGVIAHLKIGNCKVPCLTTIGNLSVPCQGFSFGSESKPALPARLAAGKLARAGTTRRRKAAGPARGWATQRLLGVAMRCQ